MTEDREPAPAIHSNGLQDRWQRLRGRLKGIAVFALGVSAALLAIMLYNALGSGPETLTTSQVEQTVEETLASATPPPAISAQVYQTILPSLVIVQVQSANVEEDKPGFGIGSGVIINSNGAILTALHNVQDATAIQVRFVDGTESAAFIASEQPDKDIAVLVPEVTPFEILPATMGRPGAMRIGDETFAVGHPFGLVGSMSAGVISGFDRTFSPKDSDLRIEGLIQFDAAVNPGNSGGPLLNRDGQVIGIVTALINPTEVEAFAGIGFAVPIGIAARGAGGPGQ